MHAPVPVAVAPPAAAPHNTPPCRTMLTAAAHHARAAHARRLWRPDMEEAEAKAFVVKVLSHAMARDASSGGCIRTVTIDQNGPRRWGGARGARARVCCVRARVSTA